MRLLQSTTIRSKLITTILTVTILSLVAGFAISGYQDYLEQRAELEHSAMLNAQMTGDYCVSTLVFEERQGASQILSKLENIPEIAFGRLLDRNGNVFADYGELEKGMLLVDTHGIDSLLEFSGAYLHVVQPVYHNEVKHGTIYLLVSTQMLDNTMKDHFIMKLVVLLATVFIAGSLSIIMQRFISKPILTLADLTERISREADYSIRIKKQTSDEIGTLYDSFNRMLDQIHIREIERDKAEEELTRLGWIIDNTSDLVAMSTMDASLIYMNRAGRHMLDWTVDEEISDKNIPDVHPEWAFRVVDTTGIPAAIKQGVWQGETAVLSSGGREIAVLQVIMSHKDGRGRPRYLSTIIRDITERKLAEEALKKAQSYINNIINSMPSVLVGVDAEGTVTQWNREAQRITGVPSEKAVGRPLNIAFPSLTSEMKRVREAMQTRQTLSTPKQAHQRGGEARYEDVTIYPLISNGVEGAVIRIDDVTEQVRLEEMMIQSEKMLSVGGLAAGMAHEINNPLAGMMQTANVMANRLGNLELPANLRAAEQIGTTVEIIRSFMEIRDIPRMIDAIHESGRRVAAIVENMLSFARKSEAATASHDLAALVDRTLELASTDYDLKREYDFKMIRIKKDYEDNLPTVVCESAKIQQVLLNILRNGAQAMQEAGVEKPQFTARTRLDDDRNMVCVEIEDNGPGMDEETCRRVFEPFYTTKPVGEGTGLGLSVSYFIITENHNGEMAVDSRPGAGATFIIRLPLEGVTA